MHNSFSEPVPNCDTDRECAACVMTHFSDVSHSAIDDLNVSALCVSV